MKLLPLQQYNRVSNIIKVYGNEPDFPVIANDVFTREELIDYIGDCEFTINQIESRKSNYKVPAVIMIMPTVVMSFFHNGVKYLLLSLLCGAVLTGIFLFVMRLADNMKQRKIYNPEKEHYIETILQKYEGK